MAHIIFLDDERDPPDDGRVWLVARSYEAAKALIEWFGCPYYISFDHDLGDGLTGYDLAKYLVEKDIENRIIPCNFTFYVHSQNPIGKANIEGLLNNYLKYIENE